MGNQLPNIYDIKTYTIEDNIEPGHVYTKDIDGHLVACVHESTYQAIQECKGDAEKIKDILFRLKVWRVPYAYRETSNYIQNRLIRNLNK